jgi:quercetin dioxygenase-like cupin family protein
MGKPYEHIQDLSEKLPEIPPESVISRTLYSDSQIKVTLFGFAPGQELTEHTAAQPAILHFLEGEGDLVLGEDRLPILPGTWVRIDAHLPHSLRAKTRLVMMLVLILGG